MAATALGEVSIQVSLLRRIRDDVEKAELKADSGRERIFGFVFPQ